MELLEPKYSRPGKPGHIWPGVYKIPKGYVDQKSPWRLACPAPLCFYCGSYPDEGTARRLQETHDCPWFGGGKTTLSWGIMSDMFLAPIWSQLDEAVDDYMKKKDESNEIDIVFEAKGKARGLAEALAILMPPFFSTGDEIVQEAMVRYRKRRAGEDYETPGIGRLRYSLPPRAEEFTPAGLTHATAARMNCSPEYHPASASRNFGLGEKKVAEILEQHGKGFPSRMLAVVHETTEEIINQIIRAHG